MDTRSKILDSSEAIERLSGHDHASLLIARGSFDILRAEHCRRLAQEKGESQKLLVLVAADENPPRTVLDARTRAELAAALKVVDYVVILGEAGANKFISSLSPARVVEPEIPPLHDIVADVLRKRRSD